LSGIALSVRAENSHDTLVGLVAEFVRQRTRGAAAIAPIS
jgi:hypothetical protein